MQAIGQHSLLQTLHGDIHTIALSCIHKRLQRVAGSHQLGLLGAAVVRLHCVGISHQFLQIVLHILVNELIGETHIVYADIVAGAALGLCADAQVAILHHAGDGVVSRLVEFFSLIVGINPSARADLALIAFLDVLAGHRQRICSHRQISQVLVDIIVANCAARPCLAVVALVFEGEGIVALTTKTVCFPH